MKVKLWSWVLRAEGWIRVSGSVLADSVNAAFALERLVADMIPPALNGVPRPDGYRHTESHHRGRFPQWHSLDRGTTTHLWVTPTGAGSWSPRTGQSTSHSTGSGQPPASPVFADTGWVRRAAITGDRDHPGAWAGRSRCATVERCTW
ncbi:hypothetical protein GCM10010483_67810 [Actinokineospora diospyrosa]